MKKILALVRTDLTNLRREAFTIYLASLSVVIVFLVRFLAPILNDMLTKNGVSILTYYPMIISSLYFIETPMMFGIIIGFFLLDEREERSLISLRVTPLKMSTFLTYRFGLAMVTSFVVTSIGSIIAETYSAGSAQYHNAGVYLLILFSVLSSLSIPLMIMFIVTFANNKIEGMAVVKAVMTLMLSPVVAFFLKGTYWEWFFAVIPTFWTQKAFWLIQDGQMSKIMLYLGFSIVYNILLIMILFRRFRNRLY